MITNMNTYVQYEHDMDMTQLDDTIDMFRKKILSYLQYKHDICVFVDG